MLVYPESAPDKLGFQIVMDDVASHLASDAGRRCFEDESPDDTEDDIRSMLGCVEEIQQMLRFDDPLDWTELPDIGALIKQLRPAGSLADGEQLLDLSAFVASSQRVRSYFANRQQKYPAASSMLAPLADFGEVEGLISVSIDRDGGIKDSASSELQRIRRSMVSRERDLRKSLNEELRSAIASGFATEEQPTIRNGRMVIPIRAEAKRKVRGFVQDASGTGQTVYIEPASCLELNNELRELQAEERREIRLILISIADAIRSRLGEFADAVDVLAAFDVARAKARTANKLDGVVPHLNQGVRLSIVEARNPALVLRFLADADPESARSVVPLTMDLSAHSRTVLITGPNAGGKTVALATVGLFGLMISHGIPIPADEATDLPVFSKILVDIGDEQSIEHDLSTFSSHLRNLRRMMDEADDRTLVLIDEAGTGTDPDEGAALAQSVLERLAAASAWTVATTHHGRLKAFAHEHPGVRNGAMEFDRDTLSPTYRFRIDVPGSSYAFEIGRRMGFPDDLLARARDLVGDRKVALEDLISDYEFRVAELAELRETLDHERRDLQSLREKYESDLKKLRGDRSNLREEALQSADRLLRQANAVIERTIREIKESQAGKKATRAARERLEAFGSKVADQIAASQAEADPAPQDFSPGDLQIGDQVVLDDGSVKAEVAELDDGHAVIVNKAVRLRVKRSRLTRVGGKQPQKVEVRQAAADAHVPAQAVRQRIDVRGQRVDEALASVGHFIDVALPSSLKRLEILHGTGTGALRQAIGDYLDSRPDVAAHEEAEWEQGGAGVTVVHLQ